ncbi:SPW repeat domain-containing protein [Allokutzneria albata]|nr:SPW repeat protein [Allokutzneria albata]
MRSRPWTRVQDWLALAAGVLLALSPLWVTVGTTGRWAMVFIGAAIGVLALVALAVPDAYIDEWAMAAAGVVALVAPWLFSYSGNNAATWTSWIVGAVVIGSALMALPASRAAYRQHHAA